MNNENAIPNKNHNFIEVLATQINFETTRLEIATHTLETTGSNHLFNPMKIDFLYVLALVC